MHEHVVPSLPPSWWM